MVVRQILVVNRTGVGNNGSKAATCCKQDWGCEIMSVIWICVINSLGLIRTASGNNGCKVDTFCKQTRVGE